MYRPTASVKPKPSARELRIRFKENRSIAEVAAGYGVSERTIQRWIAAYRLTDDSEKSPIPTRSPGRNPRGPKEHTMVRKALAAGKSTSEAAAVAGVSQRTVERWRIEDEKDGK
jgi:transposase